MKLATTLLSASLVYAASRSATAAVTIYSSTFEPPTYNVGANDNLAGQDGWSINNPPLNPALADLSFFYTYNIVADPGNNWGALGGRFVTPTVSPASLTHAAVLPLAYTSFSVELGISQNQLPSVTRDNFGWAFKSGGSNLLRVAFEPDPVVDPDPTKNQLDLVWYDSVGGRHDSGGRIYYDSIYRLKVDVSPSGSDASFVVTVVPGIGSSFVFNGTLTGQGSANLDTVGADFVPSGALDSAGDNTMYFDNLTVQLVPEASSGLTLGLCAVGLCLLYRRRSA